MALPLSPPTPASNISNTLPLPAPAQKASPQLQGDRSGQWKAPTPNPGPPVLSPPAKRQRAPVANRWDWDKDTGGSFRFPTRPPTFTYGTQPPLLPVTLHPYFPGYPITSFVSPSIQVAITRTKKRQSRKKEPETSEPCFGTKAPLAARALPAF